MNVVSEGNPVDLQQFRHHRLLDTSINIVSNNLLFAGQLRCLGHAAFGPAQSHAFASLPCQSLLGAGRDHGTLNLCAEGEGEGEDLGVDVVAKFVALLGGEDLHLFLHEGVEDAHDLHDTSAQAGDLGDDEDVAFLHAGEELSELAVVEVLGCADGLLNPAANMQLLLCCELQHLVALVVRGLLVR